jgi:hypothetical protein
LLIICLCCCWLLHQVAKGLHAEDKVNVEVAVLREAFARVQNTKKVRAVFEWLGSGL